MVLFLALSVFNYILVFSVLLSVNAAVCTICIGGGAFVFEDCKKTMFIFHDK